MNAAHPRLDALVARAAHCGRRTMAVVYPTDEASLRAALDADALGFCKPVLVGPEVMIRAAAVQARIDITACTIVNTDPAPGAAAEVAVALARTGEVSGLVKGGLHSDDLLRAVIAKSSGLHTTRRLSHAFVFDCPRYEKLLIISDAVVTVMPSLLKKQYILANAVAFAIALGIAAPKAAILSAVETPTPAIPNTVEAAALIAWAHANLPAAQVDGPFAFDNAISKRAAQIKGIHSAVAGDADILLMPNLEAGNILYKSLVYMGGAECAGLVLGAKVPIVLTSRADSPRARVASCALAALVAP
jgi:phosphate acetyltransferase